MNEGAKEANAQIDKEQLHARLDALDAHLKEINDTLSVLVFVKTGKWPGDHPKTQSHEEES